MTQQPITHRPARNARPHVSPRHENDRRYTATRQKILDKAYQIALADGIDSLSMRSIAEAVHSSAANLYEYFTNKDEIIQEIKTRQFQELAHYLTTVDPNQEPEEYLEQLAVAYIEYVQKYSDLLQIHRPNSSQHPIEGSKPHNNKTRERNNTHFTDDLFEIFKQAIQQLPRRDIGASEQQITIIDRTLACWSLIHGYASLRELTGRAEFTTNQLRVLMRQLLTQ
jgi:AcrR family transcriptional regulator